jgi:hypothetical protein
MVLLIHSDNIEHDNEYIIIQSKESCNNSNYKSIFFIKLPDNKNKKTSSENK